MDLQEYRKEYMNDVHINAQIEGTTPDDYFFTEILDKLSTMGELVDPQVRYVQKRGRNQRIMSFDGYAFDESDKSVILLSNEYSEEDEKISMKEIETAKTRMLNFLQEAYDKKLNSYFDITDDTLRIGADIGKRLRKDYVDLEKDDSIDKIKLYVITNKSLSEHIKSLPVSEFLNKRVETNIWNIDRLYELYQSGRDREPVLIETSKYGIDGIPCIKADMVDNLDYDAYLAIVPGQFLNDIYYEHGSRLLEGNVRAFLSNRGKINKGIRETIRKEPTKFFTYNNGIACTASKIELSSDGHKITLIEDLQIINGGQTTASLASAKLKDKLSLDNIFVPMKMTVVKNDDYDTVIQNISRYANSQNKVTEADLFSNHPFHRTFEELSKKIQAPVKAEGINNTLWYYERSRGKYEQEQFKLFKKSERDKFLMKYPKKQVIKKEELAKYYTCSELLRPDIVSKGSQKCMSFFAEYIDDKYQKEPEYFNEAFYRRCICDTILFRTTETIVKNASWYNVGGYRLNIVPYTISKLISMIPKGYCLNYDKIWKKQELYASLNYEIDRLAEITNRFIQDSNGVIVTEYCKKEDTWKKFKEIPYSFKKEFLDDLSSLEIENDKIKSSTKDNKLTSDINIEAEIVNLGGEYWRKLIEEGKKRKLLSLQEIDLLNIAASIDTPRPRVASPKQAQFIWKIRKKLDDAGVLV
ncbi:MAG: AIPR family protein [Erysipelotrichaceae bacterium]|nr:AIPR family protein [Erysipelotrichaceae bacterium]